MNTSLYREIIDHKMTAVPRQVQGDVVSKYSPSEIRETISQLVGEDRLDLASALGEAGLALYPQSEDILAISGLMAMLQEDWEAAVGHLNELVVLQGDAAPITSHLMFIRALRCALEPAAALSAVMLAHEQYPNHPELVNEFEAISSLMGIKSAI